MSQTIRHELQHVVAIVLNCEIKGVVTRLTDHRRSGLALVVAKNHENKNATMDSLSPQASAASVRATRNT